VRCQLHVCCGREGWQAGHCSDVGESSC
jgi:hypothetical protein